MPLIFKYQRGAKAKINKRNKYYRQNKIFQTDAKKFYREKKPCCGKGNTT